MLRQKRHWALVIGVGATPLLALALARLGHLGLADSIDGFQYSDAGGWASCARGIAWLGRFPVDQADWCLRRPAFPIVLGLLTRALGSQAAAIVALTLLMGVGLAMLTLELRLARSATAAIVVSAALLAPWAMFALGQTLSESLGLPLATLGAAALLRYRRSSNITALATGAVLLGAAELTRPANPLLPFIPLVFAAFAGSRRWRLLHLTVGMLGAVAAQLGLSALLPVFHLRQAGQGGNVWATLYGLATGNRHWLVINEIPGFASATSEAERWNLVREATLHAASQDPLGILLSLCDNAFRIATGTIGASGPARWMLVAAALVVWGAGLRILRAHWQAGGRADVVAAVLATATSIGLAAVILPAGRTEWIRIMSTAAPAVLALLGIALRPDVARLGPALRGSSRTGVAALGVMLLLLGFRLHAVPTPGLRCASVGKQVVVVNSVNTVETAAVHALRQWEWVDSAIMTNGRFASQGLAIGPNGKVMSTTWWSATRPALDHVVACPAVAG